MSAPPEPPPAPKLSDELERWLSSDGERTIGTLVDTFGDKSFALLFVLLLGVPALPLPTGGATHVFELIAGLLALQLIVGRTKVWLPDRWRKLELAGPRQQKFIGGLMKMIRRLERFSRPRLAVLLHHRLTRPVFGLLVLGGRQERSSRLPSRGSTPCPRSGSSCSRSASSSAMR